MAFSNNLFTNFGADAWIENDVRYYKIADDCILPSVTSVIGKSPLFDHSWLEAWRNAVGDEEADRITNKAARRGSALHKMAEDYVKGLDWKKKANPLILSDFLPIKKILDDNVTEVRGIEITLYDVGLNSAGTSDLIAKWKNKLAIIDYKTKRFNHYKNVTDDDILNYFVQTTAYAHMCNEMYSVNIDDIIIIMSLEHQKPIVFEKKASDYKDLMMKVFSKENRSI